MADSFFEDLFPLDDENNKEKNDKTAENGAEKSAAQDPFAFWNESAAQETPAAAGKSAGASKTESSEYDPFDIEQVVARKNIGAEKYSSIADYERAEAAKEAARIEAERVKAEREAAAKKAEKEAEEEAKLMAADVARQREDEAVKRAEEAEKKRLAEEEKRKAAENAWLEAEKKLEEERKKREAEEAARAEAEKARIAAEEQKKAEEERARAEEAQKREEEEKKRREEEQKAFEEEKRRFEEAKAALEAEKAALAEEKRAHREEISAENVKKALEREFVAQQLENGIGAEDDDDDIVIEKTERTVKKAEPAETEQTNKAENPETKLQAEAEQTAKKETAEPEPREETETSEDTQEEPQENVRTDGGDWGWKRKQQKSPEKNTGDALADLVDSKNKANDEKQPSEESQADAADEENTEPLEYPRIDYMGNFPDTCVSGKISLINGGAVAAAVIAAVLAVAVLLCAVNLFVIRPEIVGNSGMEPDYEKGSVVAVSEIIYSFGKPQKGDVIIADLAASESDGFGRHLADSISCNSVICSLAGANVSPYRVVGRVTATAGDYVVTGNEEGTVPDNCVYIEYDASGEGAVVPLYAVVGKVLG